MSHTITTAKGSHTGTLREVCAWQCEQQGAWADIDGVDVSHVDFRLDDDHAAGFPVHPATLAAVRKALAQDAD